MKLRKRILSLAFAVMLIIAMAVPASASTVAMGRQWGSFTYGTSDTCTPTKYNCVIESGSSEYTLRTDVYVCRIDIDGNFVSQNTYYGTTGTLIATNSRSIGAIIDYIKCYHYIGGTHASTQRVEP